LRRRRHRLGRVDPRDGFFKGILPRGHITARIAALLCKLSAARRRQIVTCREIEGTRASQISSFLDNWRATLGWLFD
jgi:hypothetical protein